MLTVIKCRFKPFLVVHVNRVDPCKGWSRQLQMGANEGDLLQSYTPGSVADSLTSVGCHH